MSPTDAELERLLEALRMTKDPQYNCVQRYLLDRDFDALARVQVPRLVEEIRRLREKP
jgi:hypothetical protein